MVDYTLPASRLSESELRVSAGCIGRGLAVYIRSDVKRSSHIIFLGVFVPGERSCRQHKVVLLFLDLAANSESPRPGMVEICFQHAAEQLMHVPEKKMH